MALAGGIVGGHLIVFIDLGSLLLLVVPILFYFFISKSGKIILEYVKASFKRHHAYEKAELENISAAMKSTVKATLATGFLIFLIGLISDFASAPSAEIIFISLAMNLIAPLYAIGISLFMFFPTQIWAENRLNTQNYLSTN